jgi:flagellar hook-associated protein 2
MSISSVADNASNALGSLTAYDPTQQQRRTQASNSAADNTSQAAQYAAATPPVQLSGTGQLQAALSTVQGVAGAVANVFSVNPTAATSDTTVAGGNAAVGQTVASQALPSADINTGVTQISVEVGTLNVSTGTFIPGTGSAQTFVFNAGNNSLNVISREINQSGSGVSAQVLQGALGFQLALTGTFGGTLSVQAKAVAPAAVTAAVQAGAASQLTFQPLATLDTAADTQTAQDTVASVSAAGGPRSSAGLVQGAQALVNVINHASGAASAGDVAAQAAATNIVAALSSAQGSASTGGITAAQVGITQGTNGQLTINQNTLQQAATTNPTGVASLLSQAANQVGKVAANALAAPQQASDQASVTGVSNGDNPYIALATAGQEQAQTSSNPQSSLLSYSPTTQNLYALSQYLSVSGL